MVWYNCDMRKIRFFTVIGAILLVLAPALSSQAAEKPFTDKEVAKMIADWPAVGKWFEDRGKAIEAASDGGFSTALFLDKDFKAFIAKKGWTLERFSYVSGTAFSLLMIVAVELENPDLAAQFDEAIAQIQASDLPAAEKAVNIQAVNDAKAATLAISTDKEINQAELAIVRNRYEELMELAERMKGGE
jgi:hypothetical protein